MSAEQAVMNYYGQFVPGPVLAVPLPGWATRENGVDDGFTAWEHSDKWGWGRAVIASVSDFVDVFGWQTATPDGQSVTYEGLAVSVPELELDTPEDVDELIADLVQARRLLVEAIDQTSQDRAA